MNGISLWVAIPSIVVGTIVIFLMAAWCTGTTLEEAQEVVDLFLRRRKPLLTNTYIDYP